MPDEYATMICPNCQTVTGWITTAAARLCLECSSPLDGQIHLPGTHRDTQILDALVDSLRTSDDQALRAIGLDLAAARKVATSGG